MIPITKPVMDRHDYEAVLTPLRSGWLVQGPEVARFEETVARFCNVPHAVATTSCTTALHLALVAAGIGKGDAVLVPSFTYIATANAVEHAGARPVFVDVDPDTFNIAVECIEERIASCKKRTGATVRAIIPVHLFGLCAEMGPLMELAEKYSLTVIEDAACALGSSIHGRHAGSFGLAGCFSFHPRKLITTGEGGMIVTGDESMARSLRILRDHGAEITDLDRHHAGQGEMPSFGRLGYNYRMTDIQGALGSSQMSKIQRIVDSRRSLARNYTGLLHEIPWITLPVSPQGYLHTYQSYVCRLNLETARPGKVGKVRGSLMKHLKDAGISSRPGTHAVHLLGYYQRKYAIRPQDFPNSRMVHHSAVTLPLYPGMNHGEQMRVAEAIASFKP
jgi:dTDP-4-amino-4,6-dideoxygalactose transaminase